METSEILIQYEQTAGDSDWLDISSNSVITGASFDVASNANPGTCEISLVDQSRSLPNFITGHRLRLSVDGQVMWSGFVITNSRSSFFPAGDGLAATKSRKRVIRGVDNNILLDKRIMRNPSNYLKTPKIKAPRKYDGEIIRYAFDHYIDVPSWLDVTSEIDDILKPPYYPNNTTGKWAFPQQGLPLRSLFEDLARFSAAVYYIGPDDAVHYHAIQDVESPWGFSDRPNLYPIYSLSGFDGSYYGFREVDAEEDGTELATDAFVWGGSEWAGNGDTVFHRATDSTLEGIHGKWQWAETHFGEENFENQTLVNQRAHMIVYGQVGDTDPGHTDPTGGGAQPGTVAGEGPRGLRFSQWAYRFSWFTRNAPLYSGVPRHLYPGDVVPIQLWAWSADGGTTPFTKILPLRSMKISFPSGSADGRAIVRFDGTFDLRNTDSKFLWRYLRNRIKKVVQTKVAVVDGSSTGSTQGAIGSFRLQPDPDGVLSVFYAEFSGGDRAPYILGSTQVTINGLEQRPGIDYIESSAADGEVTFTSVPIATDRLELRARMRAS